MRWGVSGTYLLSSIVLPHLPRTYVKAINLGVAQDMRVSYLWRNLFRCVCVCVSVPGLRKLGYLLLFVAVFFSRSTRSLSVGGETPLVFLYVRERESEGEKGEGGKKSTKNEKV